MISSMIEVLHNWAEKQPDRLFVVDSYGKKCTYGEAIDIVKSYAVFLGNKGVKTGDRVMVECNQSVSYLLVDLAIELVGAVFVPIEMGAARERKQAIYEETQSSLWIYSSEAFEFVSSVSYEELDACNMVDYPVEAPKPDAIAEILFTTGTTGKSKGVVISNAANIAVAENIKYGVEMKEGNVELIPVPISHSHGIRCCYANLLNGGTIILIDGLMNVKKVFQMMDEYKVTAIDVSPNAMKMLLKLSKGAFWEYKNRLDYIQIGTASLPETLKDELVENLSGVRLYNFYGSTEAGRSCVLDFSSVKDKANCIGKPTQNSTIIFTDSARNEIETDIDNLGLLATKGLMNMVGYWKQDELTAEILQNGFIYTSDLGYMDEEGFVYVLGRNDDVINYNGIKIAPEEIEEVAVKYEGVIDAACVPLEDSKLGQVPKLFIVVESENDFDMREYVRYLTGHIDANKLPKQVEFIDQIPRTYNGKIQRKKLHA